MTVARKEVLLLGLWLAFLISLTGVMSLPAIVQSAGDIIADRYLLIEDGSIIRDTVTGLEWQRCSVGQTWIASTQNCAGDALTFVWDDAIQVTAPGGFRVPTIEELRTLVYCSNAGWIGIEEGLSCNASSVNYDKPTIEQAAFPNTPADWLWSVSPCAAHSDFAWSVSFNYGGALWDAKGSSYGLRLVRGEQSSASFAVSASAGTGGGINPSSVMVTQGATTSFDVTQDTGYTIDTVTGCGGNLDGDTYTTGAITEACTVRAAFVESGVHDLIFGRYLPIEDGSIIRDTVTGLEWQRCSVGQTWSSSTQNCTGNASEFTWDNAIQVTALGGFHVPTIEELRTLVYCSNTGQIGIEEGSSCNASSANYDRPTIVKVAFPNTPMDWFWSASPYAESSDGAWEVRFFLGRDSWAFKGNDGRVRLVRGGQ